MGLIIGKGVAQTSRLVSIFPIQTNSHADAPILANMETTNLAERILSKSLLLLLPEIANKVAENRAQLVGLTSSLNTEHNPHCQKLQTFKTSTDELEGISRSVFTSTNMPQILEVRGT